MIDAETIIAEKLVSTTIVLATFICDDLAMNEQATAIAARERKAKVPPRSPHGDAWESLTRTHAAIVQRLQEMLSAADFPPLPWYEVLATVAEAPEEQMRMGDLAEALVITRGGLTKLVDRLVKAGLLERVFCATDRRVSYAALTPAGSPSSRSPFPPTSASPRPTSCARRSTACAAQPAPAEDRSGAPF
jgi:hypothetical protein